jgi:hypothetical protein
MRNARVTLRLKVEEQAMIENFAHHEQLTLSEAMRRLIFWNRTPEFALPQFVGHDVGRDQLTKGDLEKLISPSSQGSSDVNADESKREQSGINRRQFRGARRRAAIFRGALNRLADSADIGMKPFWPTTIMNKGA